MNERIVIAIKTDWEIKTEGFLKPGDLVRKISKKPFKSKNTVNTVKGIIEHPILRIPAYTFFEDESYVECRKCIQFNT